MVHMQVRVKQSVVRALCNIITVTVETVIYYISLMSGNTERQAGFIPLQFRARTYLRTYVAITFNLNRYRIDQFITCTPHTFNSCNSTCMLVKSIVTML